MKRLGLTIHRSLGKKKSKTEVVYFSTRNKMQEWIKLHDSSLINCQELLSLIYLSHKKKKLAEEIETYNR